MSGATADEVRAELQAMRRASEAMASALDSLESTLSDFPDFPDVVRNHAGARATELGLVLTACGLAMQSGGPTPIDTVGGQVGGQTEETKD